MDFVYDGAALVLFVEETGKIRDSLRKVQDNSLEKFRNCEQRYTRLLTVLESRNRKLNRYLEEAESMRREADAKLQTAQRVMDNAEDAETIQQAQKQAQEARQLRMEADAMAEEAEAALIKCKAKTKELRAVWEKFGPVADSRTRVAEDMLFSYLRLKDSADKDLEAFMNAVKRVNQEMDDNSAPKADVADVASANMPAEGSGDTSGVVSGAVSGNGATVPAGTGAQGLLNSFVSGQGNAMVILRANGADRMVVNVNGAEESFPCTWTGMAAAHRFAKSSGDQELLTKIDGEFRGRTETLRKARDDQWNKAYMPLVQENIRSSVERYFSDYVSPERLETSLAALRFMDQDALARAYGWGFEGETLGFNDGESSNIAYDMRGYTDDAMVGDQEIPGSGNTKINFAFVTAVHENLHMLSANDTPYVFRRGIMVGDDDARAMNEAFTEYFTFLSCGGETPGGGIYPGGYSAYHELMQHMPTIEKAVGRECMLDAYFNNKPQRIREAVDERLGTGAWEDMCAAAQVWLYGKESAARLHGKSVLEKYLQRLAA